MLDEQELGAESAVQMVNRVDTFAGTAADLVDWVMQRGLGMSAVTISSCHLKYQTEATEAELANRAKWHAETQRRTDEWERAAYARLKAKFEDSAPSPLSLGEPFRLLSQENQ